MWNDPSLQGKPESHLDGCQGHFQAMETLDGMSSKESPYQSPLDKLPFFVGEIGGHANSLKISSQPVALWVPLLASTSTV